MTYQIMKELHNELAEKAQDYIKRQRSHLNTKESLMFPIIIEAMDQGDWSRIESLIKPSIDPLSDAAVDRYENLLSYLDRQSDEHKNTPEPELV